MITHAEYMANSELHHAYYLEIAQEARLSVPADMMDASRKALAAGDEHLNAVPLHRWDVASAMQSRQMLPALRARGDFYSLGVGVCALKALAKHKAAQSAE